MTQTALPKIMVAPNGARRMKSDHPNIPMTDLELVETARACFDAGADGIHAHLRQTGSHEHLLDTGRYRALTEQLQEAVPDMYLQVTSEAAGLYDAETQQRIMRELRPDNVSVALREMVRQDADWTAATAFYAWAADEGVNVQHIIYALDEMDQFIDACHAGRIPGDHHLIQLVLGSYDTTKISRPVDIPAFVGKMDASDRSFDWGLCAFGKEETECLVEAARLGGKARVGFENSLWHSDGSLAENNADRVKAVRAGIDAL